jgi:hypothetical protein
MVNCFILCGPREQKKGRSIASNPESHEKIRPAMELAIESAVKRAPVVEPLATNNVLDIVPTDGPSEIPDLDRNQQVSMLVELTTRSTSGLDLINRIRHNYHGDSVFGPILKTLTQFQNFEVEMASFF